jgi:predicted DNA-binding transcriptional regulator YafY
MHLFRKLAFAYRSKTNQDEVNEWLTDLPQVRRVVRRVSNTFWLIREILRYGQDCEIVAPEHLRNQFKHELISLCSQYGLTLET